MPPYPWLDVRTDGRVWRVELGNPNQTKEAGFVEGSAKPGDTVTAIGNRDRDSTNKHMKAVQLMSEPIYIRVLPKLGGRWRAVGVRDQA